MTDPCVDPSIAWTKGYGHGTCSGHPHSIALTAADGGFLVVGDCVNHFLADNGGRVGTGNHWPAELKLAMLVVKTSASGEMEWSFRYDNGVGSNYGKFAAELADGTLLVCCSTSIVDADAEATGFVWVQRRVVLRLSARGELLSETILPFSGGTVDLGRREGFMCVAAGPIAADEGGEHQVVYLTGYVCSESGYDAERNEYDQDPMFLISLGHAFIMTLAFSTDDLAAPPRQLDELTLTPAAMETSVVFRQGMRVVYDDALEQVVVLAAASTHEEDYEPHFAAVAVDAADVTNVRWHCIYCGSRSEVQLRASHPYAMTRAALPGGYVLAGHSFHDSMNAGRPVGRALKISAGDGSVVWDAQFAQPGHHLNTECYGVCVVPEGVLLSCGTGSHDDEASAAENIWRCLMVLLDARDGTARFVRPYALGGNKAGGGEVTANNAGEFVLATPDGGAIVAIDSQTFGPEGTGGNFALMKILPESLV